MNDSILSARSIEVGYGRSPSVIRSLDVDVVAGETVGLVGANGAGKSTLLRTLAGQHPLRAGSAVYDGTDIAPNKPGRLVRRGLVFVPEGHQVIPDLTVEQNLLLGGIAHWPRVSRKALRERCAPVYDLFPILADRRSMRAGFLSGGQQQMVALGRSLVAEPRLLLLDEPSLGLAPVIVDELYKALAVLRDQGVTLLIVEQSIGRLLAICDRLYLLRLGSIVHHEHLTDGAEIDMDAIRSAYFGEV